MFVNATRNRRSKHNMYDCKVGNSFETIFRQRKFVRFFGFTLHVKTKNNSKRTDHSSGRVKRVRVNYELGVFRAAVSGSNPYGLTDGIGTRTDRTELNGLTVSLVYNMRACI